jgi:hypothetical protein
MKRKKNDRNKDRFAAAVYLTFNINEVLKSGGKDE